MELIPVSNSSVFYTTTSENPEIFMRFLDYGPWGGEMNIRGNEDNIFDQGYGIKHHVIHGGINGFYDYYSEYLKKDKYPLEIYNDSDSTTLILSLQVVTPEVSKDDNQVSYTKPDPKFSRYIMPVEIPENCGILLGNTDVTLEEGTWYEWPLEKSQTVYNNNENDEEMVILVHDVIKTKQANTSIIKTYFEMITEHGYNDNNTVKERMERMIGILDNNDNLQNYQRKDD